MMTNELCVPASALAQGSEDGGNVEPDVGDEVDFSGKGKVSRVEGPNAYITPSEINGQPLANAQPAQPEPMGDDEEGNALRAMADKEGGY